MTYKLFIDDLRDPPEQPDANWIVVRSYDAAVELMTASGCPWYVSFDNDLGTAKEGKDIAKWMSERDLDIPGWMPPDFDFYVHSQNFGGPIEDIEVLLRNHLKHIVYPRTIENC